MIPFALLFLVILFVVYAASMWRGQTVYEVGGGASARNIFVFVPCILYAFFVAALKPAMSGGDTYVYLSAFSRVQSFFSANADANYGAEYFFWPLQSFVKYIFGGGLFFEVNFIFTTILGVLSYRSLLAALNENSGGRYRVSAIVYVFVCLTFYLVYNVNIMRQAYAVPLVVLAFSFLISRRYFVFYTFILAAACFHLSSLIFLISPLVVLLKRRVVYWWGPLVLLVASQVGVHFAGYLAPLLGMDWLISRSYYYFEGGRVSHISSIFSTANFWISFFIYYGLLISRATGDVLRLSFSFFSIVCFFSVSQDISERYMVYLIFLSPAFIAYALSSCRLPTLVRSYAYVLFFFIIGSLVLTRPSTIDVLGFDFRVWL